MNESAPRGRMAYVDNLRWLMIVFVVLVHAAVTYSGIGSWMYIEERPLGAAAFVGFAVFQSFTQAYFMGFLFLLAGYFAPSSYDRKGFRRFLADRAFRLGVPTLLYMFVLGPFARFVLLRPENRSFGELYLRYVTTDRLLSGTGPLWFAAALLVFSAVYALGRRALGDRPPRPARPVPGNLAAAALAATIALAAFLIRVVQPIGTNVYNMQLCFFAQYVALFAVGIAARRNDWFERIPRATGRRWLVGALVGGTAFWFAMMAAGNAASGDLRPFFGGFRREAAAYALWESFFCVGVCLGLLVLFRERFDRRGRVAAFLSDNSFGVYVLHAPVLVAVSVVLRGLDAPPAAKFALAAAATLAATFPLSHFVFRRIPLLKRVF